MFIRTEHGYRTLVQNLCFADWIENGHELGHPTEDDLAYHLTTLFPPVRIHGWLELRMIDMLPHPWWRAAVAVPTALLCDDEAIEATERVTSSCTGRWFDAARYGLAHPVLRDAARSCFAIALDALDRIGGDAATRGAVELYRERFI